MPGAWDGWGALVTFGSVSELTAPSTHMQDAHEKGPSLCPCTPHGVNEDGCTLCTITSTLSELCDHAGWECSEGTARL